MTERRHQPIADDRSLLARAQAGDDRAFGRLLAHHRHDLELYCHLMLSDPDTAERATAQAVLTAWRERELAEPPKSVRVWLHRIAARVCFDAVSDPTMSVSPGDR